jgi:hypothetical protein
MFGQVSPPSMDIRIVGSNRAGYPGKPVSMDHRPTVPDDSSGPDHPCAALAGTRRPFVSDRADPTMPVKTMQMKTMPVETIQVTQSGFSSGASPGGSCTWATFSTMETRL